MAQNTISDELSRLIQAKADIKSALEEKGLTIGDSSTLDEYPALIQEMQTGGGSDTSTIIDLIERDITSFEIPEGTTKIGNCAFANCNTLMNVTIPNSVTFIDQQAFTNCTKLSEIIIPNLVTSIGAYAFSNAGINRVIMPNLVTSIGGYAFDNNSKLNEIVLLPQTPPTLQGKNVFYGNCPIYVRNEAVNSYKNAGSYWSSYTTRITPLASMDYDSTTYTVTALGRDNLELYVDASLINSSVYTFVPDDSSHIITVKSVDPSLGVLDEVSQEILVEEIDYSTQYFGLTGIQDASVGLTSSKTGGVDIKYSSDGENWTQWDYANETLNLPAGETLYFKGNNPNGFSGQSGSNSTFQLNNGNVSGHGNIQSLLYDDNFTNNNTIPSNYCYCLMFQGCTSLTTAQNLILPATTLTEGCYSAMFMNSTSLTTAPELPATTLVSVCYGGMFNGCTNLNYIKAMFTSIPDTTLAAWVSGVHSTGTFVMNPAAEWNPENYRGINGVPLYWTIEGWTPPAAAGQTFVKVTSADQLADGKKCIIVYDDVAMGSWKETETGNHDGDFVGVSVTAGNEIDISNTETPDPETPGWVLSIDVLTLEAISGNQYNLQYDNGNYVFSNRQGTSLSANSNPFAWNITNQDNFGNNFNYFAIQHSITNSVYINSTGEAEEYCFNMTTGNPAMLYVEKTT